MTIHIPPPYSHQHSTSQFISRSPSTFIASDPGTGKTRSVIDAFKNEVASKKMLVFCPKSIMVASWAADLITFAPHIKFAIASAPAAKRLVAFNSNADVVIINHDATKWCNANIDVVNNWLSNAEQRWLVVDESTAFKTPSSARTKAMLKLLYLFNRRVAMSGFPTPNNVMEMWAQMRIIDDGQRMGKNYYQTRHQLQHPIQEGQFVRWVDKADAHEKMFEATSDVTVRYKLEDVLDMPEHINRTLPVDISTELYNMYQDLQQESYLQLSTGEVNAVNKAVLQNKLLQLCSGAVYNEEGGYSLVHPERYELIHELIAERQHSLVAFLWKHQFDQLTALCTSQNTSYCAITSEMSAEERGETVAEFQSGKYQVLFAHPQSAGHGITLTKARSIIWASPTWSTEQYVQFNRRIYRAGQQNRTEVINVAANGTVESSVYDRLNGKIDASAGLLEMFEAMQNARK